MSQRGRPPAGDPERLVSHLAGRHLVEPPEATVRRAVALRAGLPARAARTPGARRALAQVLSDIVLRFDSAASPLPAGVRRGATGERRLLYGVREGQLDLRLRLVPGRGLELAGQVLPPPPAGASVTVHAGRTRRAAPLGACGDFLFAGLPAGARSLRLVVVAPGSPDLVVDGIPAAP